MTTYLGPAWQLIQQNAKALHRDSGFIYDFRTKMIFNWLFDAVSAQVIKLGQLKQKIKCNKIS